MLFPPIHFSSQILAHVITDKTTTQLVSFQTYGLYWLLRSHLAVTFKATWPYLSVIIHLKLVLKVLLMSRNWCLQVGIMRKACKRPFFLYLCLSFLCIDKNNISFPPFLIWHLHNTLFWFFFLSNALYCKADWTVCLTPCQTRESSLYHRAMS